MVKFKAIGVSEGLAKAKALVIKEEDLSVVKETVADAEAECKRVLDAVEKAKQQIEVLRDDAEKNIGAAEAEIFDAHLMMLDDPDFVEGMTNIVTDEKVCAEYACFVNCENFQAMFRALDDEYMQARAADIGDISQRVIKNLKGIADNAIDTITEPCIIVANDLTPSDTAKIGGKPVAGFITKIGGRTSHSAIMARSMGIPAIVGAGEKADEIADGDLLLIDGAAGEVVAQPDEQTLVDFAERQKADAAHRAMLAQYKDKEGATSDGRRVIIEGNIGTPDDAVRVAELGGEGVGLFRSEFLFMDRTDLPSEEEQFAAYKKACEIMQGKPVIIRTLDIGGDKEIPYMGLTRDENPFLGYRAIRFCLDRKDDVYRPQLRALLRASAYGNIKIMVPMVTCIEELREAKALIEEIKKELDEKNIPYKKDIEVGIMVETAAASLMADVFAKEAAFFSIGTNDLTQYTMSVDRGNDKVSYLYSTFNPAVLRSIKRIITCGREAGIMVGMCGEAASDPLMIPLLLAFGLNEFSMSASAILFSRKLITGYSVEELQAVADKAMSFATAAEVEAYMKAFAAGQA